MNRFNKLVNRHFIKFDSIKAVIVSYIIFYFIGDRIGKLPEDLFQEQIGVAVSLLGFLIATIAIIFSFKDGPKLTRLQGSEYYYQVIDIYLSAISWQTLFTIFFFATIMFSIPENWQKFLLISFIVFSVIKIWRCVWIAKKMFLLSITKDK